MRERSNTCVPSYLLYYPVNRQNYPVYGVFWSLTFAAGPDHSRVLCPAVRQASIPFPHWYYGDAKPHLSLPRLSLHIGAILKLMTALPHTRSCPAAQ